MSTNTFEQFRATERQAGIDHRGQERQNRWHDYLLYVQDARRNMPGHPDEITWSHLRSCRKALEAATSALDEIEARMERPYGGQTR